MPDIIDSKFLELDDCFSNGCIVDSTGVDMKEVERLMSLVQSSSIPISPV